MQIWSSAQCCIPGKLAPKVIKREFLKSMNPGSVIVDISIDQGGCCETSRPTTHADPIYVVDGVIHYCVTNMPGACARTSTMALTNATLPYALDIANKGWKGALKESRHLREGLNVCNGFVTNGGVAHDLNYTFTPPECVPIKQGVVSKERLPRRLKTVFKEADEIIHKGRVQEIEFSQSTYQVKVIDPDYPEGVWAFLQFDSNEQLQDSFCSCETCDEKGVCPHITASYIKIFNRQRVALTHPL